ncbi:hypothetical protein TPASS_0083 [Treponema pallidum subsp. pallidum SS14]|uniref:DUF4015 domain-containing protein n=2 Tax=Treponema pallidum subsp. pallidum TaxID=161 RepID=O83121_TREPA|nr:conserved hypothetical protein [Treponema pallidum subsp. pallidum str. Nichols]ACD70510.1 hypothetical protein TPASS_0083 [Treponema pallidum subsp. pallidum SS14]
MPRPFDLARLEQDLRRIPDQILCAWVPRHVSQTGDALSLSELWLLHDRSSLAKEGRFARADLKKGIYVPAHHIKDPKLRAMHFKTIADNKLNMLVYDMKDELGMVRYQSQDPFVRSVGAVRPFVDMKTFVKQAKEKKLYLIARIVVFKDKYLFRWNGFELAVKAGGKPWQGYKNGALRKEEIHEHWVDPYNEKVWRYNVAIAKEAIEFGFDEVQFDYIRFPTDGDNLHQAEYPARESGMDRESALMSFLAYARERIDAPISIDIYGANGWYRTGARTGQDVELLAEYVDVICPMFYPSHFSQSFLAYAPAQERPYRIYYYGGTATGCWPATGWSSDPGCRPSTYRSLTTGRTTARITCSARWLASANQSMKDTRTGTTQGVTQTSGPTARASVSRQGNPASGRPLLGRFPTQDRKSASVLSGEELL